MSGTCTRCGTNYVVINATTSTRGRSVDCTCAADVEVILREFECLTYA